MTNHAVSNRADLRERTKTMSRHGDRRGQIADFRHSFETINWLYLLFKCGIKTKTHFEWLLWHWSSLGQLNLEPTRPNGLVGCKVPTDLVKISVKEATHMGFHYIVALGPVSLRLMTSQFKDIVTHTQKSKTVKWTFCGVWVQNFVWNFKGALWNFTQNFEPIHRKICILQGSKNFTTYDILKLWHLKS